MENIIYLSEALIDFSTTELTQLAQSAAERNKNLGITGYLCYSRGRFLQYIEGESKAISDLYKFIEKDQRHDIIYNMTSNQQEERIFPHWSMRYITTAELQRFNLEHSVEQNILYIKNNFPHKARCREFVWKQIQLISKLESQQMSVS